MSLQFSKGDIMVSMPKLAHLQQKHLERFRDKTPAEAPHYNSHVLDPFKTAIEKVEMARISGEVTAAGDIHVASLGEKLPAVRILEEPFHNDLLRVMLGTKFPMADPASRFGAAVASIKYHIWAIPDSVLRTSFQEARLDPALSSVQSNSLSRAMAYIVKKISANDEGAWTRAGLEEQLRHIMSESVVSSICGETGISQQKFVYRMLRWALVASEQGLPVAYTMEILGREETLRRLNAACHVVQDSGSQKSAGEVTRGE